MGPRSAHEVFFFRRCIETGSSPQKHPDILFLFLVLLRNCINVGTVIVEEHTVDNSYVGKVADRAAGFVRFIALKGRALDLDVSASLVVKDCAAPFGFVVFK